MRIFKLLTAFTFMLAFQTASVGAISHQDFVERAVDVIEQEVDHVEKSMNDNIDIWGDDDDFDVDHDHNHDHEVTPPVADDSMGDTVVGSTMGVDILTQKKNHDVHGHYFSDDFFGHNTTSYPLYVRIYLKYPHKDTYNVHSELMTGNTMVNPGERVYLGTVSQTDVYQAWGWYVEWEITPHCDPDSRNNHPMCGNMMRH